MFALLVTTGILSFWLLNPFLQVFLFTSHTRGEDSTRLALTDMGRRVVDSLTFTSHTRGGAAPAWPSRTWRGR